MMSDTYIVICLADAAYVEGQRLAPMVLATRRVFATQAEAESYAKTIHYMRYPGVVAGDFVGLRVRGE